MLFLRAVDLYRISHTGILGLKRLELDEPNTINRGQLPYRKFRQLFQ